MINIDQLNFDWLIIQQNVDHNWIFFDNDYCFIICSNNAVINDLSIWLFIEQVLVVADMILSFDVYSSDVDTTVCSIDEEDLHSSDYFDFEVDDQILLFLTRLSFFWTKLRI